MATYELILLAAMIISVIAWRSGKSSLPYFHVFLSVAVLFELFITHYAAKYKGNNIFEYNVYANLCVYYYLFVFSQYFRERTWNQYLRLFILLWIAFSTFRLFAIDNIILVDVLNYNGGMAVVLLLIVTYLHDLVSEKEYRSIFKEPYFYFSFGILVFYTASFPMITFINYLIVSELYEPYYDLLKFGNIFLSLAYLGTALCSKVQTRSIG